VRGSSSGSSGNGAEVHDATSSSGSGASATGTAGRDMRVVLFSSQGEVVWDQRMDMTADYQLRLVKRI
jgi:hypothetical protein